MRWRSRRNRCGCGPAYSQVTCHSIPFIGGLEGVYLSLSFKFLQLLVDQYMTKNNEVTCVLSLEKNTKIGR